WSFTVSRSSSCIHQSRSWKIGKVMTMAFQVTSDREEVSFRLRQALVKTFEDISGLIVSDIRTGISELYPPPSKPGEEPHERTGLLINGVRSAVVQNIGSVLMVIYCAPYPGDAFVPLYLEMGTPKMAARPFMSVARDLWVGKLTDIFTADIRGN